MTSSGSSRESAVKPHRSANNTVTGRRSASELERSSAFAGGSGQFRDRAQQSAAMAHRSDADITQIIGRELPEGLPVHVIGVKGGCVFRQSKSLQPGRDVHRHCAVVNCWPQPSSSTPPPDAPHHVGLAASACESSQKCELSSTLGESACWGLPWLQFPRGRRKRGRLRGDFSKVIRSDRSKCYGRPPVVANKSSALIALHFSSILRRNVKGAARCALPADGSALSRAVHEVPFPSGASRTTAMGRKPPPRSPRSRKTRAHGSVVTATKVARDSETCR